LQAADQFDSFRKVPLSRRETILCGAPAGPNLVNAKQEMMKQREADSSPTSRSGLNDFQVRHWCRVGIDNFDTSTLLFRRRSVHSLDKSGFTSPVYFGIAFAEQDSVAMQHAGRTTLTPLRHVTQ
jgi:hypothetical protein